VLHDGGVGSAASCTELRRSRGTEGSNPSPSSGESAANLTFSIRAPNAFADLRGPTAAVSGDRNEARRVGDGQSVEHRIGNTLARLETPSFREPVGKRRGLCISRIYSPPTTAGVRHSRLSRTASTTVTETRETGSLLTRLEQLWLRVPGYKPLSVGIVLLDLVPAGQG